MEPKREHRRQRRVSFAETDMAGIIHFGSYFLYMEETEHEFLRGIGLSVHLPITEGPNAGGRIGFPRIATRCEFRRPLRFEELVDIELRVARIGNSSITYQHLFTKDGAEIARGEITAASVQMVGGSVEAIRIPEIYRERIAVSALEPLTFGKS